MIAQVASFFESVSNSIFGQEESKQVDPRIEKILSILNRSADFQELMNQPTFNNIKIVYHFLSDGECKNLNIDAAMMNCQKGLFSEKVEILIKDSLPEVKKCRGVLMEICNVFFRQNYFDLLTLAKSGSLEKKRFAYFMEKIEWKAFKKAISISKYIDSLKLYDEPLYNEIEQKSSETLDSYLEMHEQNGHTNKYRIFWEQMQKA